MNKKEIIKLYKTKLKLFKDYSFYYYEKSKPIVSDEIFDTLKKEIILLEKKFEFLNSSQSPSATVGFKPSKNFQKVTHRVPMLSLANAFDKEDLDNFEKKILNFLDYKKDFKISYTAEPKIDGISASLIYKNGLLIKGVSRGDGKNGEDITQNLKTISDIPHNINSKNFPNEIDIRGEVYIENNDFKNISNKFANARNAASGSLRQKDPNETKKIPLKFIAYTFGFVSFMKIENQFDFLNKLREWGFKTNPNNKLIIGIENLINYYNEIEKIRNQLDFDIDGIVYKVNEFTLQKRLGSVANSPRWAIAHKFPANSATSQIQDIEIQIGRTGALTPVAKIKPINIGGVIVSNATLHNEDEIERKDIRIGDTVKIERAGDVIPHIIEVDFSKRSKETKKFNFPIQCPSCGSKTIKEFNSTKKKQDAVRRCTSEGFKCEKVAIEKLKHFVSKEAFNIEGFGKKIVENFFEKKIIKLPQDIFKLDYDKIKSFDGWGRLSVSNLKYSIDQRKIISLERFIYALGIRHIGLENAKILARYFKSSKNFIALAINKNFNELLDIDGIGDTQVNSLINYFLNKENQKILNELQQILKIQDIIQNKNDGNLKNKTFLITGKLSGISRAELKSIIERNSGSIISSVSKKLNYLIVGDNPTKHKIDKANELNIKILTQNEILKMTS